MKTENQTEDVTRAIISQVKSVNNGLEMLAESKNEYMNTLAQIAIILNDSRVRSVAGIEDQGDAISDFLGSTRWLLNSLNLQSYGFIKNVISNELTQIETEIKAA